jgi:sugar phosphate isomerase/epimerase
VSGERILGAPDVPLERLLDAARERSFGAIEIRLPAQMPFVSVPRVRTLLAERGLRCGAVACDARPNAPGRLRDGIDSLRQATRAAAALGASLVPFTIGAHDERSESHAAGLVGHELRAVAALAAEVGVRLGIESGSAGSGVDPSRTIDGALRLIAFAGSPRFLGLVLGRFPRKDEELPPAAAHRIFARREPVDPSPLPLPGASVLTIVAATGG